MVDERIKKLAKNLVRYSCDLQKGEKILIEAKGVDYPLINEIIKEVYAVGGLPFVEIYDNRVTRQLLLGETEELAALRAKFDGARMAEMDAYIGIRGGNNGNELSDVPEDKLKIESSVYSHPVHSELRVKKTKWVILRYPNEGMAQQAGMSSDAFENFFFNVCNLDYSKMNKAMDSLKARMDKADRELELPAKIPIFPSPLKGSAVKSARAVIISPTGKYIPRPLKIPLTALSLTTRRPFRTGLSSKTSALRLRTAKLSKRPPTIRRKPTLFSTPTRVRDT